MNSGNQENVNLDHYVGSEPSRIVRNAWRSWECVGACLYGMPGKEIKPKDKHHGLVLFSFLFS